MALIENPPDTALPITPEEASHALANDFVFAEDPALRLVVRDLERAENAELSKLWVTGFEQASIIYQSPTSQRYWQGTMSEAASVPFYTVATAANALIPQIINGLFYENPPFMIEERPGTTAQAARAVGDIIGYQMEDINFREELRLGSLNAVLYGTEIWQWGWESFTRKRFDYELATPDVELPSSVPGASVPPISSDDIQEVEVEERVDRPVFEHIVNLKEVLVDPGLNVPDIRKGKYVIRRRYVTYKDLDKLRQRPGFTIPSEQEVLSWYLPPQEPVVEAPNEEATKNALWDMRSDARFAETTENPFDKPLELLERWDNETYIVILQRKLVIANDTNPYGKIPFLSVNWWDVPGAFWGMGLGRTIGSEQRLQQGLMNLALDQASLLLNGVYVRVRGKSIPTQNIRIAPGKIIEVEDKDGFKPLERQPAIPEAVEYLSMSQARAEQVSGANEISSQGIAGASGHSNIARSSAGAQALTAGAGNRVSDFVEKLSNQVLVPFLYEVYSLNRRMLPPDQWRNLLNDELESAYLKSSSNKLLDLLQARVKFNILAGAKMQVRRNMAQSLPLLTQTLFNPQINQQLGIQGMKIDIREILRMWLEAGEWKNEKDIIVPMASDEMQRWQQAQPGAQVAAKGQQDAQMQQTKFEQEQQLLDQANEAKAGRDILRHAVEAAGTSEAITGEPDASTGFGSAV